MRPRLAQSQRNRRPARSDGEVHYRRARPSVGEGRPGHLIEHPARFDGPDSIDKGGDPFHPMLRDHGCHPELRDQPQHDLEHILGRLGIELRGGLVERERLGVHREGRGNRHPLTFPARQGGDPPMAQRVDADLVDHLFDAFAHQWAGQTEVLEAEGELRLDILEQELGIGMLEDEPDPGAELTRQMRPRVQAADGHPAAEPPAGAVRNEAVKGAKERRFSAAGSAAQ